MMRFLFDSFEILVRDSWQMNLPVRMVIRYITVLVISLMLNAQIFASDNDWHLI